MFLEEKDIHIPERRVASSKMKFRNFEVEERMNVINEINGYFGKEFQFLNF